MALPPAPHAGDLGEVSPRSKVGTLSEREPGTHTKVTDRPLRPTLDLAHRLVGLGKDVWVRFVLVTGLKWDALGKEFTLRDTPSPSTRQITTAKEIFAGEGLKAV
jgi:pyruvate formate lyase activating enzyme